MIALSCLFMNPEEYSECFDELSMNGFIKKLQFRPFVLSLVEGHSNDCSRPVEISLR